MKKFTALAFLLLVVTFFGFALYSVTPVKAANFTLEYDTAKPYETNYGYNPQTALISYNSLLYGVSRYGGAFNSGTIYAFNPATQAKTLIHSFNPSNSQGFNPVASLTEISGVLYGVTYQGGTYNKGVLFKINASGTGYTVLHSFEGANGDGAYPYSKVLSYNGKIYGTTIQGGNGDNAGIVYSINPDGTNYAVLHAMSSVTEGNSPYAGLIVYNSVLYGSNYQGGTNSCGSLYKINPDGTNFSVMHHFACGGVPNEGQTPTYELLPYNGKLYGVAGGGTTYKGVMYSINPDGTGYSKILSFTTDIETPSSGFIEKDGVFYGASTTGAANGVGAIYSILPDGTGSTLLHSFAYNGVDGFNASGTPVLVGSTLYGTAQAGGTNSNNGTLYKITTAGTNYESYSIFSSSYISELQTTLVPYNGLLYGTSVYGGSDDTGSFFSFNPVTKQLVNLHSFLSADGTYPYAAPILYNNTFYGTLSSDGSQGYGSIYSIKPDGSNFQIIHSFDGSVTDGNWSMSQLLEVNGVLYGTTYYGGDNNSGILFSINPDGTNFTLLHSFSSQVTDGRYPYSGVTYDQGKLYGTTRNGGANSNGTIYSINIDGTGFTLLHSFNNAANDYGAPQVELVVYNGKLFGTTEYGGASGYGTLYSIDFDGNNYQIVHEFTGTAGDLGTPAGSILPYNGKFYGVASYDTVGGNGGLYSINPDGTGFSVLHVFEYNTEGGYPYFHVVPVYYNKKLYATNTYGGIFDSGTIYSYALPDIYEPTILSLSPLSGATLTPSATTIHLSIDENATCRASFLDQSYDDMGTAISCTGGGTQNAYCTLPVPTSTTTKPVFFACADTSGNKNTALTNTQATYTWSIPPASYGGSAPETTPTPTPENTPLPLELSVTQNNSTNTLLVQWNLSETTAGTCTVEITDATGAVVYVNNAVSCTEPLSLSPETLSALKTGTTYTLTVKVFSLDKTPQLLATDSTTFEYRGQTIVTSPSVIPTTGTPTPNVTGTGKDNSIWWLLVILGGILLVFYIVMRRRKNK